MSISWSIGTYNSRQEQQEQLDRYYKWLSMQAEINAKQRDAENQSITRSELKLNPIFTEKSSVEKLKDGSLQRELAYNKLKTIFSTTDAEAVLGSLIVKDELLLFNTYADKFFDEYKISQTSSSTQFGTTTGLFQTNWNLFLKKISSADNIGTTLADIKDILEGSRTDTKQLLEDIKQSGLSANEKAEAIRELLMESYVQGQAKFNDVINEIKKSSLSANEKSEAIRTILVESYVRGQKKFNDIINEIKKSGLSTNEKLDLIREIAQESYVKGAQVKDIINEMQRAGIPEREAKQIVEEIKEEAVSVPKQVKGSVNLEAQASRYATELNNLSNQDLKETFDNVFGSKDWVQTINKDGKKISKRKDILLESRDDVINALVLKEFPQITQTVVGPRAPEEISPEGYFLDLIDQDEKHLDEQFRNLFKDSLTAPILEQLPSGMFKKAQVAIRDRANKYIADETGFQDSYAKAIAIFMKKFPKLSPLAISQIVFDPRNISFGESPAISPAVRTPASSKQPSFSPSPIQSPASSPENPATVELVRGLNEEFGFPTPAAYQRPVRQVRKEVVEVETREARNFVADLLSKQPKTLKTYITNEFNRAFGELKDDENVPTWDHKNKQKAMILKAAADSRYWKKTEAVILKKYPNADLNGIELPFKAEGVGLPKPTNKLVPTQFVPKHKAAGRYLVHIPSLQKGYLYIQYPSGWRIQHFKKRPISSDMQTMIWNMVDDKEFDSKLYKKLKAEEKKLYDEVVHMIRVPVNEIKGLGMHKKITDVERDQCMKRLKILSGEIMAGSNSKKTIKELKILVLKMLDKGYISRADFNKLVHQIMVVEE